MRYLTLREMLEIYDSIVDQSGGGYGIRDMKSLESSLAQPRLTFDGKELYLTVVEKAAILCFSIISNHPFVDGNKRAGHAAMETFLFLNDHEIDASVEVQEKMILSVASGEVKREAFSGWLQSVVIQKTKHK